MAYVVQSDITYRSGELNVAYWRGGSIWAYHPSDAAKFPTRREAMATFSRLYATPAQRRNHPHTYSAVKFDDHTGLFTDPESRTSVKTSDRFS